MRWMQISLIGERVLQNDTESICVWVIIIIQSHYILEVFQLLNGIICSSSETLSKINSSILYIKQYILEEHYQQIYQKRWCHSSQEVPTFIDYTLHVATCIRLHNSHFKNLGWYGWLLLTFHPPYPLLQLNFSFIPTISPLSFTWPCICFIKLLRGMPMFRLRMLKRWAWDSNLVNRSDDI